MVNIYYFSLKEKEVNTLLLGITCKWDRGLPNNNLITIISNAMSSVMDEHDGGESRTEIDSHENMVVVGKHTPILDDTGNKVDVIPFTPEYQAMEKLLILDVAVQYTCQYTAKVHVIVFRNYLSVPIMNKKLIALFITIEAGLLVNDIAKIYAMDPYVEDHSIYFNKFDIHITLFLQGLFSYFPTSNPSLATLEGTYDIYLTTKKCRWDPGSDAYTKIKERMMDWKGKSQRSKTGSKLC